MADKRLDPGSEVVWTHSSVRGRTCSLRLREGKLVRYDAGDALIRTGAGREVRVPARLVHAAGTWDIFGEKRR